MYNRDIVLGIIYNNFSGSFNGGERKFSSKNIKIQKDATLNVEIKK